MTNATTDQPDHIAQREQLTVTFRTLRDLAIACPQRFTEPYLTLVDHFAIQQPRLTIDSLITFIAHVPEHSLQAKSVAARIVQHADCLLMCLRNLDDAVTAARFAARCCADHNIAHKAHEIRRHWEAIRFFNTRDKIIAARAAAGKQPSYRIRVRALAARTRPQLNHLSR